MKSVREGASNTGEGRCQGERYDNLATGQNTKEQRQRQNKRLIEGAKEVGGRNSSRTKGSDGSRHVGGESSD